MSDIESLDRKAITIYVGMDVAWDAQRKRCEIGQDRYADAIKTNLTDKERRKVFSAEDLKLTHESERNDVYTKAQQAWTGVLGWLAKTQPHLSVVFSEMSRNNSRASKGSVLAVQRACEYAKKTHKRLVFEGIRKPTIVWWVDASFNLRMCEGRTGCEVQLVETHILRSVGKNLDEIPRSNIVSWRSRRCKSKLASTTGAELLALVDAVKAVPAYTSLVEALWGMKPDVMFITDSQGALGWLRTGRATTDPHMQGYVDLVRERVEHMGAEVVWIEGSKQRADKHTKFVHIR